MTSLEGSPVPDPADGVAVPSTPLHLAIGSLVTVGIVVLAVVCTPIAGMPLPVVPGFITVFGTAMILLNLRAGIVMINRGSIEGRGAAVVLGSAYLVVAGIFVPFLASFPDAIMPGSLLGTPGTAIVLWACWHSAFALSVARYAVLARGGGRGPSPRRACLEVLAVVAGSTAISVYLSDVQSSHLLGADQAYFLGQSRLVPEATLALALAALVLCARLRARTTEELYVTLSIAATCLDVWLTMNAGARFSLGWYVAKGASLLSTLCATGFLLNETVRLYRFNAEARVRLRQLACVDGLTGIANRRRFDEAIDVEWRRARRTRNPVSLLLVDVDFFKAFNDRYGHVAGDRCLRAAARGLADAVRRPADLAARYGGEEFAVVLPDTDQAGSLVIAERIRLAVQDLGIEHERSHLGRLTVSIGAATRIPDRDGTHEDLVADADEALYRAKGGGRNRVGSFGSLAPPTAAAVRDVIGVVGLPEQAPAPSRSEGEDARVGVAATRPGRPPRRQAADALAP